VRLVVHHMKTQKKKVLSILQSTAYPIFLGMLSKKNTPSRRCPSPRATKTRKNEKKNDKNDKQKKYHVVRVQVRLVHQLNEKIPFSISGKKKHKPCSTCSTICPTSKYILRKKKQQKFPQQKYLVVVRLVHHLVVHEKYSLFYRVQHIPFSRECCREKTHRDSIRGHGIAKFVHNYVHVHVRKLQRLALVVASESNLEKMSLSKKKNTSPNRRLTSRVALRIHSADRRDTDRDYRKKKFSLYLSLN